MIRLKNLWIGCDLRTGCDARLKCVSMLCSERLWAHTNFSAITTTISAYTTSEWLIPGRAPNDATIGILCHSYTDTYSGSKTLPLLWGTRCIHNCEKHMIQVSASDGMVCVGCAVKNSCLLIDIVLKRLTIFYQLFICKNFDFCVFRDKKSKYFFTPIVTTLQYFQIKLFSANDVFLRNE